MLKYSDKLVRSLSVDMNENPSGLQLFCFPIKISPAFNIVKVKVLQLF